MALLTIQTINVAGLNPTFSAVNSSDTINPYGIADRLYLEVHNANAGSCTVTLTDAGKTDGGSSAANPTVSVPATTGVRKIFIDPRFVDPTTGLITVSYSVTASVTAGLFTL